MKYSEIKNLSVSEFLLLMQQSVKSNTESIKGNNAAIDSIINKEVKSKSRDEKLDQLVITSYSIHYTKLYEAGFIWVFITRPIFFVELYLG